MDEPAERKKRNLFKGKLLLSEQDYYINQTLNNSDSSNISLTSVSSQSSSYNTQRQIFYSPPSKVRQQRSKNIEQVSINQIFATSKSINTKKKYFSTSNDILNTKLPEENSLYRTYTTSSNKQSYRNSIHQSIYVPSLSNDRRQNVDNQLSYGSQESIHRSVVHDNNNHDKSLGYLNLQSIPYKKRTIINKSLSNKEHGSQAIDKKPMTLKRKILNILKFTR